MSLLQAVRERFAAKVVKPAASYAELVRDAAAGKTIDPTQAAKVLDAAGKVPDDFERDIATARRRMELVEAVGQIPTGERMVLDGQFDLEAAATAFEAAKSEHERLVATLNQQIADGHEIVRTGKHARRELIRTVPPDDPRHARLEAAQRQVAEATANAAAARQTVKRLKEIITAYTQFPSDYPAGPSIGGEREKVHAHIP